jgi:hypothetical protein
MVPPSEETKRGEKDDGESERPIRPTKQGNPPQGTQRRKGGAGDMDLLEGKTKGHRTLCKSQRNCDR